MITIERAENGFVMTVTSHGEMPVKTVFESNNNDIETLQIVLATIVGELGFSGGRHDSERIYIKVAPGDNHPNFKDEHGILIG